MNLKDIEDLLNKLRLEELLSKNRNMPESYAISACHSAFQGYREIIESKE